MKLRIRSLETKETVRIEITSSQSLNDLKTLISGKLSSSSSSMISPQSVRLSLNQTDEIVSSSPDDSLLSLGLTSGDLLFCTLDRPSSSETLTLTLTPTAIPPSATPPAEIPNSEAVDLNPHQELPDSQETLTLPSVPPAEIPNFERMDSNPYQELSVDSGPIYGDGMEVDTETLVVEKAPSLPCFLKRVMEAEKGVVEGNLGLIVVAVHAVFLESGFVVCGGNGSRLPEGSASATTPVSVHYTVPDLLDAIEGRDVKCAVLKFSVMGNYVSVYGFLSGDGSDIYNLCLDASKRAPLLISCMNAISREEETEIFQLWKIVKDELSLPLMIDICEKNGLPTPPCFARLPTDIKAMIFELLPGVDVARIGCTSSEMRYFASNDELWKKKFVEEFGLLNGRAMSPWKKKFVRSWARRKEANKVIERRNAYRMPRIFIPGRIPFRPPRIPIIGGDYDLFPAIGGFGPTGPGLGFIRQPVRRNFSPQCNLGGHNPNFRG